MKKQILNIGKTLSRSEQKQINGGGPNTCVFTITRDNGQVEVYRNEVSGATGEDISSNANSICVNAIYDTGDTVAGCGYDCVHDNVPI